MTLSERKAWTAGNVAHGVVHRGQTYLFAGPEEAQKFLANPDAYAQVLSGIDPVLALDNQVNVPGRREFGVFSGNRVYLVFTDGASVGIVFRRDQGPGAGSTMCEWCHSVRSGDSVGLLTATATSKRRVGIHACRDLSCKEKLESTPGVNDFQEMLNPREKARRLVARMSEFVRREII